MGVQPSINLNTQMLWRHHEEDEWTNDPIEKDYGLMGDRPQYREFIPSTGVRMVVQVCDKVVYENEGTIEEMQLAYDALRPVVVAIAKALQRM